MNYKIEEVSASFPHLWKVLVIIISSLYIAKSLTDLNPWGLLLFISFFLTIIILKKTEIGLHLILFSVFFADGLKGTGLITSHFTWIPEVVLVILSIKVIYLIAKRKKIIRTPIDVFIVLFFIVGILSTLINERNLISSILAFRIDLKFPLMFFLLANLELSERVFKRLINATIFLLVIQVPIAFLKFLNYGQLEDSIGTYASFGGGLSTTLPLMAISIFLGFYFFNKSHFYYILYMLGFVLFSVFAGKRAFIYYFPFLIFYLLYKSKKLSIKKGLAVTVFIISSLFISLYFTPFLRPGLKNPRYLVEVAISNTNIQLPTGEAGGRFAATRVSYSYLTRNHLNFIFGFGPGSMMDTYFKDYESKIDVPIYYGETHVVITSLEYGYLGLILYFLPIIILVLSNQKVFNKIENNYWKSISFGFIGIGLTSIILSVSYQCLFRIDTSAFIFWLFAAAICCVKKQKKLL